MWNKSGCESSLCVNEGWKSCNWFGVAQVMVALHGPRFGFSRHSLACHWNTGFSNDA
jgi:hypothetical protein